MSRYQISDCKPITSARANLSVSNHNYISTFLHLTFTSVNTDFSIQEIYKDKRSRALLQNYRGANGGSQAVFYIKLMILGEMFCCLLVACVSRSHVASVARLSDSVLTWHAALGLHARTRACFLKLLA